MRHSPKEKFFLLPVGEKVVIEHETHPLGASKLFSELFINKALDVLVLLYIFFHTSSQASHRDVCVSD